MTDDDLDEVTAYVKYEWDCPCGTTNTTEHDPAGEEVTCDGCGDTYRVGETR